MPRRYPNKLTERDILALLKMRVYHVDPNTGTVYNRKMKPIVPIRGGREDKRLYIRLYANGTMKRGISLARLVWMSVTLRVVPRGFEIHHRDENTDNNSWTNLYCLFELDHRKLHGKDLILAEAPF